MSAGAPWSVKGIDPKAREVAKDLARRSGMTLGEWLNRVILEDEDPEQLAAELAAPPRPDVALHSLEYSVRQALARLDATSAAQARLGERLTSLEGRFEALASGLSRDVEGVRADFAARLAAAPPGAADLDARLGEMALRIERAERQARDSVERIGREVLSMAEAVSRRLTVTEERSAEAIDLVGTEIARIAGAVEARLARAEQAQAEAWLRLGDEVSRVTDRFAERLETSERRSAVAIEGVGDQVSRLTERLEARHARTTDDLAERIRQAEVRTAVALQSAPPAEATRAPFGPELFSRAEAETDDPPPVAAFAPASAATDGVDADGEVFTPIPETDEEIFTAEVLEDEAHADHRPLSTREVIDQARANARAAHEAARQALEDRLQERASEIPRKPLDVRAAVGRDAASGRLFNGFGRPRRAASAGGGLHTALMVAGGAAFLSVGAAGVVLMEGDGKSQPAAYAPFGAQPRAAVALAPGVSAPAPVAAPAFNSDTQAAFAEALKAIAVRKAGGLASLKALAEQGYGPAQLYLAGLYETGEAGVIRNPAETRRWTALAAEGGEARAMHNLGVYYFTGEGGAKDLASAAQWFRKAADLGVVESQYNLGLMYQSGSGVQRDLAEARRWFDLAAVQGDDQARQAGNALTPPPQPAAPALQR